MSVEVPPQTRKTTKKKQYNKEGVDLARYFPPGTGMVEKEWVYTARLAVPPHRKKSKRKKVQWEVRYSVSSACPHEEDGCFSWKSWGCHRRKKKKTEERVKKETDPVGTRHSGVCCPSMSSPLEAWKNLTGRATPKQLKKKKEYEP